MGRASIKCGTNTTIYDKDIANSTSVVLENTASTGSINFKLGSTNGDTAVTFKNSGGAICASFSGDGQALFNGPVFSKIEAFTVDAGLSSNTYTAAQLLKGIVSRTGSASFTDKMPSAATVVDAIGSVQANTSFMCTFRNTLSSADTITLANSDDGTFTLVDANKVIDQNKSVTWLMIVTSPTATKTISGYLIGSASLT